MTDDREEWEQRRRLEDVRYYELAARLAQAMNNASEIARGTGDAVEYAALVIRLEEISELREELRLF